MAMDALRNAASLSVKWCEYSARAPVRNLFLSPFINPVRFRLLVFSGRSVAATKEPSTLSLISSRATWGLG